MEMYGSDILRNEINFEIIVLEGKQNVYFLEMNYYARALIAFIAALVGIRFLFEIDVKEILFMLLLIPIIVLLYNGASMILSGLKISVKEVPKLFKMMNKDIDIESPFYKHRAIKELGIAIVIEIFLVMNYFTHDFTSLEKYVILIYIIIFIIKFIIDLLMWIFINNPETIKGIVEVIEEDEEGVIPQINFNFQFFGFIYIIMSIILFLLFIFNVNIENLFTIKTGFIAFIIIVISFLLARGLNRLLKKEQCNYYLDLFHTLKDDIILDKIGAEKAIERFEEIKDNYATMYF